MTITYKHSLLLAALGGLPAAAEIPAGSACTVLAQGHSVVVSGLPASAAGQLCLTTDAGHECRAVRADRSGMVISDSREALDGPIWITYQVPGPRSVPAGCTGLPQVLPNESKPLIIALLSALAAFVTGLMAVLVPRWWEFRNRSREAATLWVGEYLARLGKFKADGSVDPGPRPLPYLASRDGTRLSAIATLADQALGGAGYALASSAAEREAMVRGIVAALRCFPGPPPGHSNPAGGS